MGCHVSGIKGVSAGFCTGMPVRESHCQTADGHATPSPRHLFSSVCIPAFLCMGVFRKMIQREFPPCKMSHPFTSPKEAKAAKFSALKWKECWIGSQHKIRSAPSSATGEQDPALQNASFTYGPQTVPVMVYLVWKLYRTQSASHHVCETLSTTGTWSLLKP